jgi:tetratricopeptide (TPR) repeat protein
MRTVFLSSTSKDLTHCRDASYRAIEGLRGYHCVRMEDFGSWSDAPDDFCRARVAECDVFVCIVGPLYGSRTPAGASYTEREFDAAIESKKPCLVFLTPEDFPLAANAFESDDDRKAQATFRQKASRGRVVTRFSTPEDIALKVVQAIRNWENEQGNVGSTAEQVVAALEARGLLGASELAGLQRKTIISLAIRLRPDVLDFEQAVTELERAVEVALEVIAKGERGTNEESFVNAVLAQVADKVRNDDLEGGASAIDQALAELDAQHRRAQVVLLEEGVKVDTLRRDAVAVARRIELIVAIEHPAERPTWRPDFAACLDEFERDGEEKGINLSLEVAAEFARRMRDTAGDADERGAALNRLGNALQTLGRRENGTARLAEAVAAYRAALGEMTRDRVPLAWARTQNNLGSALQSLGERESGTARLTEAVDAYRAALEECVRERVPLDWAITQNNLANALAALGVRESGTARLTEAVAAYRAALEERTRDRVPLAWARTQNNLGSALQTLGERESGTARLIEAVDACRAALAELTRDRVPLDWGTTQNNLGNALHRLGERESGTARLIEAVDAYRAALEEMTRDRVPLDWAMTQNNLGNALATLGERERGTARLTEAVAAYRAALEERTRDRVPLDWAMTQNNLGNALATLGERESGTARLTEAVDAYRAALEERTRDRVPLAWATSFGNQGIALIRVAERIKNGAIAETACQQIEAAFKTLHDGGHESAAGNFKAFLATAENVASLIGRKKSV